MQCVGWLATNVSTVLPGTDKPVVLSNRNKHRSTIFGRAWMADTARHVIGCHSTQETRVQSQYNDVASIFRLALNFGPTCDSIDVVMKVGRNLTYLFTYEWCWYKACTGLSAR